MDLGQAIARVSPDSWPYPNEAGRRSKTIHCETAHLLLRFSPMRPTPNSEAAFAKASAVIPGGVSSPVRAFKAVGGNPIFIKEGQGCILKDIDGNSFIDYVASYGPLILGHAHEIVVAALSKAIARGTTFGAPTEAE